MSRAVSGRRSAIRNATSESCRISLSVSWLTTYASLLAGRMASGYGASGCDLRALEVLVRRAVVPLRKRRALARLALAGRRVAACDAALEDARLDLLLDELDRGADAVIDRPGHLRLHGDREIPANVLEKGLVRLREVVRIRGEPLHRRLAGAENLTAVLEPCRAVDVRIDQVADRPIDRSRILIHTMLDMECPLIHG